MDGWVDSSKGFTFITIAHAGWHGTDFHSPLALFVGQLSFCVGWIASELASWI